ncbi:hypothetical protein HY410_01935 [Candidatus Gottesmanbacteria bacterium]|nr:hypothetical protein [Candidatus Gottesmanbacteria bacterium]
MPLGRREFLELAGAAGLSFLFGSGDRNRGSPNNNEFAGLVGDLKRFEILAADRPLSIAQAEAIVPTVSEFFVASEGSPIPATEFRNSVHIIPSDPHRDGWVDREGNIFINLDGMNSSTKLDRVDPRNPRHIQFSGVGTRVDCSPITPAVKLVTRLHHEMAHRDSGTTWRPLDPPLLESFRRLRPNIDRYQTLPASKKGFVFNFGDRDYKVKLDEFAADYRAATAAARSGLPYNLAYPLPDDVANFDAVLKQAGISHKDFQALHRGSDIQAFLLNVANHAKGVSFGSPGEALDFGMKYFYAAEDDINLAGILPGGQQKLVVPLLPLKPYYPEIAEPQMDLNTSGPEFQSTCFVE